MIIIGRHQEGVTLNPLEYILNEDGSVKKFSSEKEAKDFLLSKDIPADALDDFYYEETK